MGAQSRSEGAVLRFAKYYTPAVVLTCLLIIVVPAAMQQGNLKVGLISASAVVYSCTIFPSKRKNRQMPQSVVCCVLPWLELCMQTSHLDAVGVQYKGIILCGFDIGCSMCLLYKLWVA